MAFTKPEQAACLILDLSLRKNKIFVPLPVLNDGIPSLL
jgi:hypothetical protein